jgi:hypothetical protein
LGADRLQIPIVRVIEAMATTKKAKTGKTAGASARKGAAKAKGVAPKSKSKAAAKTAPAAKKAAGLKLNDRQTDLLKRVGAAGATGYVAGKGPEQRSIDALVTRKLLKKGAKNKETGKTPYFVTKAGQKQLPAAAPAPAPAPAPPSSAEPLMAAPPAAAPQASAAPPPTM